MNKKVLIIDGSARKKNTYNVLAQIGQTLEANSVDVEILNLFDYTIKDCVGCEVCVNRKGCCRNDDMNALMQKIMESDGVILGSPVYMCSVTSKLKAFADRTIGFVHKPEIAGKPMMFVATTASTGLKETRRFFESYATGLGARKGEFISRKVSDLSKPVEEKEMRRFLNLLNQDLKDYKPAMNEIVMFAVGKVLALKSNGDDNRFWQEKGWLDKKYYYPCKMNPFKKLFSGFIFKVISKAMK